MFAANIPFDCEYITDNANTECAYFPADKKIIVINNSDQKQSTVIKTEKSDIKFSDIEPFDTIIKQL